MSSLLVEWLPKEKKNRLIYGKSFQWSIFLSQYSLVNFKRRVDYQMLTKHVYSHWCYLYTFLEWIWIYVGYCIRKYVRSRLIFYATYKTLWFALMCSFSIHRRLYSNGKGMIYHVLQYWFSYTTGRVKSTLPKCCNS